MIKNAWWKFMLYLWHNAICFFYECFNMSKFSMSICLLWVCMLIYEICVIVDVKVIFTISNNMRWAGKVDVVSHRMIPPCTAMHT